MHQPPFLNRELSWLAFNERVLEEARDPTVPLLDRLRFLAIFSANLDEFFMVRYAGIWRQIDGGVTTAGPDGLAPREVLAAVSRRVHELVAAQHALLLDHILPELAAHGVYILAPEALDATQRGAISAYFHGNVLPLLTPIAIDPGHPFPYLTNRALCLVAELEPSGAGTFRPTELCIIHLPAAALPRFVPVPSAPGQHTFVLLEDVVRAHLGGLYPENVLLACHAIRVTRDAELDVDEDAADDLINTIETAVRNRRLGAAVRLQYPPGMSRSLVDRLARELELVEDDLFTAPGFTALTDLGQVYQLLDLPALKSPPWTPQPVAAFEEVDDVFAVIDAGDVLVHHPYQSFDAVVRFLEQAATDPHVLAIKTTLYRVSGDSRIARALLDAAQHGKQVAVLVELRARFSEEANIAWARRLEASGAHVVYGVSGYKTHVKAAMVVRRTAEGVRRYVHLSTGNYNEQNAAIYTDFGLFTSKDAFGQDLTHLFNLLTGYARPPTFQHLMVAPMGMRTALVARIRSEAERAGAGVSAGVVVKVNSLVDPELIEELYAAGRAGVPIQIIVRGMCCLRPGVPGLSDNIRVISIIDRFLEHARVFRFENAGAPEYWLSSADWMQRNLDGRVEAAFPILDPTLQREIEVFLQIQLADGVKARVLGPDGNAHRPAPIAGTRSQERLMEAYRARGRLAEG